MPAPFTEHEHSFGRLEETPQWLRDAEIDHSGNEA
jgi:hypothetical protein